jgi:hypothetical protein
MLTRGELNRVWQVIYRSTPECGQTVSSESTYVLTGRTTRTLIRWCATAPPGLELAFGEAATTGRGGGPMEAD